MEVLPQMNNIWNDWLVFSCLSSSLYSYLSHRLCYQATLIEAVWKDNQPANGRQKIGTVFLYWDPEKICSKVFIFFMYIGIRYWCLSYCEYTALLLYPVSLLSFNFIDSTRITLAPTNVDVTVGFNATMQCLAEHDPTLDLTFIWTLNGYPVDVDRESDHYERSIMVRFSYDAFRCKDFKKSFNFLICWE